MKLILMSVWMTLALQVSTTDTSPSLVSWGLPSELADSETIWIETSSSQNRERIIQELQKGELRIAANRRSADVVLIFDDTDEGEKLFRHERSRLNFASSGTTSSVGRGQAVRILEPGLVVVYWEFQDAKLTGLERFPAVNFGREFAALLKRMRSSRLGLQGAN